MISQKKYGCKCLIMITLWASIGSFSCSDQKDSLPQLAEEIFAAQGQPLPGLSETDLEIFKNGENVAKRRFSLDDGLGPDFNVTFCGSCHEKPTFGGAAGHYRDFYIYGEQLLGGGFVPSGPRSGVLDTFTDQKTGEMRSTETPQLSRVVPEVAANHYTRRNPIPFFGIGLLAEIDEADILSRADPDDLDGDGISGRPNYDQGYVGRFGLKAQTVSIENFIRGPLFNHLGITSNPLSPERQAALPVPSVAIDRMDSAAQLNQENFELRSAGPILETQIFHQAAAPSEPLTDDDHVADPELSEEDLFALVSWAMLLAAPMPDPLDAQSTRGQGLFHAMDCDLCHTPQLNGPRGLVPAYTDLLLHDMGEELADGVVMALASGSEFRTQPLWGVSSTGPYLYDGRAGTLDEAIALHGGEASRSRDQYLTASIEDQVDLIVFLESLGGRMQKSSGLIPPQSQIGDQLSVGQPLNSMSTSELERFISGQTLFDTDFSITQGLGPKFNGDSCRGCHFDPFVGGSGPTGVSAVRILDESDMLADGDLVHRYKAHGAPPSPTSNSSDIQTIFEIRQALPSYGLGVLEQITDEEILVNVDPNDLNQDGVRGAARWLNDGKLGRYGWRAQIADLDEFIADALGVELGMTTPDSLNIAQSMIGDQDEASDPELSVDEFNDLVFFLRHLAPPVTVVTDDLSSSYENGEILFDEIGCAQCHVPKLSRSQAYSAYTDLLLHDVQPQSVNRSFRTPPLWGIKYTGSYWHDGRATTVVKAIELHAGEAMGSVEKWMALNGEQKDQLLVFLNHL